MLKISIKNLDDSMELPSYAHTGDAGLDLRASVATSLRPGERKTIPCGIAIAIPDGYAGLIIPRSGLASKEGITIVNSPGLIDSGYRGEVMAVLLNTDMNKSFQINAGDRIAQLVIIQVPEIRLNEVDVLPKSSRDENGFGSSGIK